MLHTLLQSIRVTLNVDENEVSGFLIPKFQMPEHYIIALYETSFGGSGIVSALLDTNRFQDIIQKAREILHENDPAACERAVMIASVLFIMSSTTKI